MKLHCTFAVLAAAGLGAQAADDADLQLGRKVFLELAQPACAVCHALEAAGATGTIGPSLDELDPDAERVLKAVRGGIGAMPPYAGRLTSRELNAVAGYVAAVAGEPNGTPKPKPNASDPSNASNAPTCRNARHASPPMRPHASAGDCADARAR